MNRNDRKRAAARAALEYVVRGQVLGVGTGSTADLFVDALAESGIRLGATVSSSEATTRRLRERGYDVVPLDTIEALPLYVDGADEFDPGRRLVKGGGGALTREKIVAEAAERFVCIVDDSKRVDRLGAFPLPVEVIPMAVRLVSDRLAALGGRPVYREGFLTDNGNIVLDVHGMSIDDPVALESEINQIPGVVTNGLFARRPADVVLCAGPDGVERLEAPARRQ